MRLFNLRTKLGYLSATRLISVLFRNTQYLVFSSPAQQQGVKRVAVSVLLPSLPSNTDIWVTKSGWSDTVDLRDDDRRSLRHSIPQYSTFRLSQFSDCEIYRQFVSVDTSGHLDCIPS